jgi:FAD-NAD(P)-binding protein
VTRVIIIGGGLHGAHLAVRLLRRGLRPSGLTILDPAGALLDGWRQRSLETGMEYLRSTVVHHIGEQSRDLWDFARQYARGAGDFAPPYQHPLASLFQRHCDFVVGECGLEELHMRDRAIGLDVLEDRAVVTTLAGRRLPADYVVLAIGNAERPHWPDWSLVARHQGADIEHVFAPGFRRIQAEPFERPLVVGGGITAIQIALALTGDQPQSVTLLSRHPVRVHPFDVDSGWMGPRQMAHFSELADYGARRRAILAGRKRASAPIATIRALRRAIAQGRVQHIIAPRYVAEARAKALRVTLPDGHSFDADRVLLATGFEPPAPGMSWIDATVRRARLRVSDCGYPVPDVHLRWHERLFVMGPLAELELGAASRSIVGARMGAARIIPLLC